MQHGVAQLTGPRPRFGKRENPLWVGFWTLAAGLFARPTRNAPLMTSARSLCHAFLRWVQGSARPEKVERNQSSDVHNTLVVNSSGPPALWCLVVCPSSACLPANVWTKRKVCLPQYDMVALAELFIVYRPSQHNARRKEPAWPKRAHTVQVRNKKHHANPPMQKLELQTCVTCRM